MITKEIAREVWEVKAGYITLDMLRCGGLSLPYEVNEPDELYQLIIPDDWDKYVAYKIDYRFEYKYFVNNDENDIETRYTWYDIIWNGEIIAMVWR